jgi:predicted AAA+ superfamily ATPase
MYQRIVFKEIESRLLSKRKFIQVISGPRQVGKTTIIHQLLSKLEIPSTYISADIFDGNGHSWIEKQWESVRIKARQNENREHIIAIDEIQKIPEWSSIIKKLWDEDTISGTKIKLILSGSSGLLVQKGLSESLTGRFEINHMSHWSYSEMNEAFGWTPENYVWFGGYPGSEELINDEYRWKRYICDSIVETSITKDILMLTRIDKPALMRQLFELGCTYSGQILSFTKMLGQLQDAGNTVTLSHYLNLLGSAGILSGIEKYSGSVINQRSSSPKFLVRNTALMSSRMSVTFKEIIQKPEKWGRIVESSVGAHLLNLSFGGGYSVYYWRQGNDEIDFILKKNENVIGIEIKSGNLQKRSGMETFKRIYNPDKIILIGDKSLPWQEFLKIDPAELFFGL